MNIKTLPIGKKFPEVVNVVIEIPKGSHNKYEYDEELDAIKLDRVLYSPVHYPTDYGFIPETRSEDGDHLDLMVLCTNPLFPGCVIEARPLALMKMIDGGDEDFKILGVAAKDPRYAHVKTLEDVNKLNPMLTDEIAHFFEVYKKLEKKETQIQGWENHEAALSEIKRAYETFKSKE